MPASNRLAVVAFCALALATSVASAQNLLVNPGFEDPITMDGPPFVGFWEGFSGGAGASAANSAAQPRNGAMHLDLSIVNTDNTFAGVFQDVTGLIPGQVGTWSVWNTTPSNPLDLDAEMRIEWRDSVSDTEISRTPNLLPAVTNQYTLATVSAAVPPGADTARLVYAIQTFSGGPTNNGTVFLDDASFVIPEPSAALLGMAGCALLCASRRRA